MADSFGEIEEEAAAGASPVEEFGDVRGIDLGRRATPEGLRTQPGVRR